MRAAVTGRHAGGHLGSYKETSCPWPDMPPSSSEGEQGHPGGSICDYRLTGVFVRVCACVRACACTNTCKVPDSAQTSLGAKCRQIRRVEGLQTLIMASSSPSTPGRPLRGSAAAVEGDFFSLPLFPSSSSLSLFWLSRLDLRPAQDL